MSMRMHARARSHRLPAGVLTDPLASSPLRFAQARHDAVRKTVTDAVGRAQTTATAKAIAAEWKGLSDDAKKVGCIVSS
jgi:hypothetical protein